MTAATSTAIASPSAGASHAPEAPNWHARLTDWIWHVRGSVALAPGQSADEAFDRLDPLFRQTGTSRARTGDTLTFSKKDAAAQDKMVVFTDGVLRIDAGDAGPVLHYRLTSRALLFCFLAPLLFLFFAQSTIVLAKLDKPKIEAKDKKPDAKKTPTPLNPIDKALGAPAPEKPKKKGGDDDKDKKPSPTPGYVFAGIFAALYVIGRVFEARRIRALFARTLLGA
jgi:hypothetical protein